MEPDAHYARGLVLLDNGDVAGAGSAAETSLQLASSPDRYALLGEVRIQQRRWQDALNSAAAGLETDRDHVPCLLVKGYALAQLGQETAAEAAARKALAVDPESAPAHMLLGRLLLQQSQPAEAAGSFVAALRLDPSLEGARLGLVQAIKARYTIYRVFLRYAFWMGSLDRTTRWFVIVGLYIAFRVVASIGRSHPEWSPVLEPLIVLYVLFVFSTWMGGPISNLLLRLHPLGRLVLSPIEILASNLVGGCLAVAVTAGIAFAVTGSLAPGVIAGVSLAMALPIAGTFSRHGERGWRVLAGFTAVLGAAAIVAVIGAIFGGLTAAGPPLVVVVLGVMLFGWVANFFSA